MLCYRKGMQKKIKNLTFEKRGYKFRSAKGEPGIIGLQNLEFCARSDAMLEIHGIYTIL